MTAQASELAAIVGGVRGILAAIAGIGHVYLYQPVALRPSEIPAVMQVNGVIDYWSVTCESTREEWLTNESVLLTHDLALRGYRQVREPAVDDPAFQALTSTMADTLRPRYRIENGTTAEVVGPAQTVARGQHRMLAETFLVHYSELRVRATERVTIA
jgi:hypothetical protein